MPPERGEGAARQGGRVPGGARFREADRAPGPGFRRHQCPDRRQSEDLRDKVHVDVEGDKVKGQVSFPLEGIGLPAFKGRYLNGKATLKVSLEDGFLRVTLDALEVKGKPVPATFIDQLRTKNLAEDASRNPENAEAIRKLESIQVKDGKVIIKARAREDAETKEGDGGGRRQGQRRRHARCQEGQGRGQVRRWLLRRGGRQGVKNSRNEHEDRISHLVSRAVSTGAFEGPCHTEFQRLHRRLEAARYRRSRSASNLGRFVLDRAFLMTLRRWIA